MTKPEFISAEKGTRVTAHALHVGDRINTIGFEAEALPAIPLAIRAGKAGVAVMFRYRKWLLSLTRCHAHSSPSVKWKFSSSSYSLPRQACSYPCFC